MMFFNLLRIKAKRKSSLEWYESQTDLVILEPNGWNHGVKGDRYCRAWLEPITHDEFMKRCDHSVCMRKETDQNKAQP
jgi:hypothetical protein